MTMELTPRTATDRTEPKENQKLKKSDTEAVPHKKHLRYFARKVDEVTMDLLECNSTMNLFKIKILDTMGYLENVTLAKDSASCTCLACRGTCHHLVWVLHNVFHFTKDEPLIYKKKTFTQAEWQKIINAFPEKYKKILFVIGAKYLKILHGSHGTVVNGVQDRLSLFITLLTPNL